MSHYTKLHYTIISYFTVLYHTILYCTILNCTVLYCTIFYCTILFCTMYIILHHNNTIIFDNTSIFFRTLLGDSHSDTVVTMYNLSELLLLQGSESKHQCHSLWRWESQNTKQIIPHIRFVSSLPFALFKYNSTLFLILYYAVPRGEI